MTTSVAMCTYNGAQFIKEQLLSILHQTMPVDEIVICDDCSTDETLDIIEEIQRHTSIRFLIIKNKTNIGFFKNFLHAMSLCTGDVIFLADQDDIWLSNKVDVIMKYMSKNSIWDVVFTDGNLIDECGRLMNETLFERVGFDKKKQIFFQKGYAFDIWAWCNRATGATMAIRSSFLHRVDLMTFDQFNYHDELLAVLAISNNSCNFITERLINYRLHSSQNTSIQVQKELYYSPLVPCPYSDIWERITTLRNQQQKENKHEALRP